MASTALVSSVSALAPSKGLSSSSSLVGFSPRLVSFSSSSSSNAKSSSRPSLMVKSQQQQVHAQIIQVPSIVGHAEHAPWTATEDQHEVRVRFDMPGMTAEDIDVKVEGDMLVIKDMGRMYSPYNTKLELPPYCLKHDIKATLKNGVLHISVPKTAAYIPVKPVSTIIKEQQAGAQSGTNSKVHFSFPITIQDGTINRLSLQESPRYVRAPWSYIEDDKEVKVSVDVPGLLAEDIHVDVVDDQLIISGSEHNVDNLGRKILSFDVKLQLPINCAKDKANVVLKNGVLYITLPKIPNYTPINVVQARST